MTRIQNPTTSGLQTKVKRAFEQATDTHTKGVWDVSYRVVYVIYQLIFGSNARWKWYPSGENMLFEYNGTIVGALTAGGNFAMAGQFFASATIEASSVKDVEGNDIP